MCFFQHVGFSIWSVMNFPVIPMTGLLVVNQWSVVSCVRERRTRFVTLNSNVQVRIVKRYSVPRIWYNSSYRQNIRERNRRARLVPSPVRVSPGLRPLANHSAIRWPNGRWPAVERCARGRWGSLDRSHRPRDATDPDTIVFTCPQSDCLLSNGGAHTHNTRWHYVLTWSWPGGCSVYSKYIVTSARHTATWYSSLQVHTYTSLTNNNITLNTFIHSRPESIGFMYIYTL